MYWSTFTILVNILIIGQKSQFWYLSQRLSIFEPTFIDIMVCQRLSIFEPTFISHIFTVTGRQNVFWTRCKHFFYSACDSNNLCGCLCPLITPPLRPVFATNNQILLITRPLSSGPHTEHMFQILSSFLST